MKRICLIIDNPLRDLDGICLIAWHLARSGCEVFIVPMNFQGFEIPAIQPDVVVANYVRNNNINALRSYHNAGARVAILDTEGIGTWWKDHAKNMQKFRFYDFVDQYYCWGKEQAEGIRQYTSLHPSRIKVTGCPRYDFISQPLRQTLPSNNFPSGYVLINTNFPVINPQYEKNTDKEVASWVRNGVSSLESALAFTESSRLVFKKLLPAIQELSKRLPEKNFIIRPHPFESLEPYLRISDHFSNVRVIKEGTSLEWINRASVLLQLNCLTGLDATMMGIETIGFEWLNEAELKSQSGEADEVTRKAASMDEMVNFIENVTRGIKLPEVPGRKKAIENYIEKNFKFEGDCAAQNVAKNVIKLANENQGNQESVKLALRQRVINLMCTQFGAKIMLHFKLAITSKKLRRQHLQKIPMVESIEGVLVRIGDAMGTDYKFEVRNSVSKDYSHPRSGLGLSIRLGM
jgi:surface carbohydrate biosynthesis protein